MVLCDSNIRSMLLCLQLLQYLCVNCCCFFVLLKHYSGWFQKMLIVAGLNMIKQIIFKRHEFQIDYEFSFIVFCMNLYTFFFLEKKDEFKLNKM